MSLFFATLMKLISAAFTGIGVTVSHLFTIAITKPQVLPIVLLLLLISFPEEASRLFRLFLGIESSGQ